MHLMKKDLLWLSLALISILFTLLAGPVLAAEPTAGAIGLQEPVTPVAERIVAFHNGMLYVLTGITLFVLGLLVYVVLKFNAKANPVPSKTTHNVPLEIVWTLVPVIILLFIAVPSLKLLYYADRVENPEMTIKVTGNQWNWTYEYPDHGGLSFTSYLIPADKLDPARDQRRLLSVDNPLVVPVDTTIVALVTASDVLHAFTVPAFGIKIDAVPGRLNQTWFRVTKTGRYFGQCSELCGKDHGFMPIEVRVVPKEDFAAWAEAAQKEMISYDDFVARRGTSAAVQ